MDKQSFVENLYHGPIGQKIIQEQEAIARETRQAIKDELDAQHAARRQDLPVLQDSADKARATCDETRAKFEAAEHDYVEAERELRNAKARYAARRNRMEGRLRVTAHAQVDLFIQRLQDEMSDLRARGPKSAAVATNKINSDGALLREHYSDSGSVARRLEAMRAAIAAAESLKLEVLEPADFDARLASLYDELPAVESESTGVGLGLEGG